MNKDEIKKDPIAEKIVQFIAYLKNNLKIVFAIFIILIAIVVVLSRNVSINESKKNDALKEADKIMIELISSSTNNLDISENLKDQIDLLYEKYPESEAVNYLGLLVIRLDSVNKEEKINLIKNTIKNEWFKTQAFLMSGDYYSDNSNYELAKKDYKSAIEYASSNLQKGYCHYKLGNIYFELDDLELALSEYKKAERFFNFSKNLESLERELEFKDWVSRNKTALYMVENLLKK